MIYEIEGWRLVIFGLFFSLIGIVTGWFMNNNYRRKRAYIISKEDYFYNCPKCGLKIKNAKNHNCNGKIKSFWDKW